MSWKEVTITKSGERMLSRMINGSKLTFTRVVLGDSAVNENALHSQTAVFSPINAPALLAGKEETQEQNGTRIRIQIRNDGVKSAVQMRQVGLYAETARDEEVLFAILQDEIGEEIPSHEEFSQFLLEMYITVAIGRTNNIQITTNPLVYATAEELREVSARVVEASSASSEALKIITEIADMAGGISSHKISVPTEGWQGDSLLFLDLELTGVEEDMTPLAIVEPESEETAIACGLGQRVMSGEGFLRFFTETAPEKPINVNVTLLTPTKGSSAGGRFVLEPATADRLGGVKIGEGVAVEADGRISANSDAIA
ncbi:MAG: hypothetical protein NC228_08980, partial [[Eubacterium] siraeum]|nr:hypothetical protein [[Eubacterium] siraeum]